MAYAIDFTSAARREFAKLTPAVRRCVAPAIDAPAHDPRPSGAVKLEGGSLYSRITDQKDVIPSEAKPLLAVEVTL